jgi:putative hydrolase of the HAD superfamily
VRRPPRQEFLAPQDLWEDWQTHLHEHIAPDPHLKPFIEAVKARFALAIVTNGGVKTQRPKLDALELPDLVESDRILISGAVGAWKPDPRIFELAARSVGHRPADCLFIGDDPARDIEGAHRAGMKTCWVRMDRNPEEAFATLDVWPDAIVNHYTEVLELL